MLIECLEHIFRTSYKIINTQVHQPAQPTHFVPLALLLACAMFARHDALHMLFLTRLLDSRDVFCHLARSDAGIVHFVELVIAPATIVSDYTLHMNRTGVGR